MEKLSNNENVNLLYIINNNTFFEKVVVYVNYK